MGILPIYTYKCMKVMIVIYIYINVKKYNLKNILYNKLISE